MWKPVLAAVAALSLYGASLAVAQQAAPADPPRWQPSAEDRAALLDARIAALKTGLKLSAEQEKLWPAVETAIRDLAKERADRMTAWRDARAARRADSAAPRPDAIERLRRGADAMGARAAALKKLADAAEPLYKTLDEGQKRRFSVLLRTGERMGPMGPRMRRGRG